MFCFRAVLEMVNALAIKAQLVEDKVRTFIRKPQVVVSWKSCIAWTLVPYCDIMA